MDRLKVIVLVLIIIHGNTILIHVLFLAECFNVNLISTLFAHLRFSQNLDEEKNGYVWGSEITITICTIVKSWTHARSHRPGTCRVHVGTRTNQGSGIDSIPLHY